MKTLSALRCSALAALLLCGCAAANAGQHTIPLFVSASPGGGPQGVLRLLNEADTAATVNIEAIGDDGNIAGSAVLTLDAFRAVELSAAELQSGSPAKGLATGLGALGGNVRLTIDSDVPVVPSAYVRGADGTLAAMNATVPGIGNPDSGQYRYDVALFHPAGHVSQRSRLRLVNPGGTAAQVTIGGRDDGGAPAPGGAVRLTLPPGGARTLSAQQLEAGDPAVLTGRLGAGAGNWRLSVSAERAIGVAHVSVDAAGDWRNLSATAIDGWAPENAAAFQARFLDRAILVRDGSGDRLELRALANGRIRESAVIGGVEIIGYEGPYEYQRTGRGAARVTLLGEQTEWYLHFASPDSGWYAHWAMAADIGELWSGGEWSASGPGVLPLDLGAGPDSHVYTAGAAIGAETLPEATGGEGDLTYSLEPDVPGLNFDPATRQLTGTPTQAGEHSMTYRVSDGAGGADWRHFRITVRDANGGGLTVHRAGETVPGLPSGIWEPDRWSGGSLSTDTSDNSTELENAHLDYFETGGYRYTCQSAGGCLIRNREVVSGTILRAPAGGGNGGGDAPDDHGDTRATATAVAVGSATGGVLTSGDIDYFRVAVSAPGTLEIYTAGSVDTEGQLERADGSVVSYDDDGGSAFNFRIEAGVSAGDHFVRVNGYSDEDTGGYTLHVRFADTDSGTVNPPDGGGAIAVADFDLSYDNRDPSGIAFANGRFHVVDSFADRVYAYTASGERDPAADFDLQGGDRDRLPSGIVFANGRFHVVDLNDDKVYAYTASGARDPAADFDLSIDNNAPEGIAFADGRFFVVDLNDDKVYAYAASGARVPGADFDLRHGSIPAPGGIAFTNGRFHVVDRFADRVVYAYTASGERDPAADFDLRDGSNFRPEGIVFADGRFFVVDPWDEKVYVYAGSGARDPSDTSPSFAGVQGPGDRAYTSGTAIAAVTLPAASGGDGALTYSLAPNVPGLTFDPATRRLSGTPTRAGTYNVTYTATDADGDSDSLEFTIAVTEPATVAPPVAHGDCRVGLLLNPGDSCAYPGTTDEFTVTADGRGRILFFTSSGFIDLVNSNINGRLYDFAASHQHNGVWRIDRVDGRTEAPADGRTQADDRAVLVALYEATDGPNWVNNENWLTDAPLGEWHGVEVNSDGRVIGLELSGEWDSEGQRWVKHGLTGQIPPILGNLTALQVLDLNLNDLSGPIPPELGNLARLEKLEIPNNALSGPIPPELGNLTALSWLNLGANDLSGPVPVELTNLRIVHYLGLGWNAGLCVPAVPRLRTWMIERRTSLNPCPRQDGVTLLPRALMRDDGNGLSLALPEEFRNPADVSVSDPSVVDATVDGGWLRLTPRSRGVADVTLVPAAGGDPAMAGVVVRAGTGRFGIDVVIDQPAAVGYEEAVTSAVEWWSAVLSETEWPDRQTDCSHFEGKLQALADELVIWAETGDDIGGVGTAATCFRDSASSVALEPAGGVVTLESAFATDVQTVIHEIGHILGIALWSPDSGLVTADGRFFLGTRAVGEFRAGGGDSTLPGVPIVGPHWSNEHVTDELMSYGGGGEGNSVSIAALADAGYNVDMTKATAWRK